MSGGRCESAQINAGIISVGNGSFSKAAQPLPLPAPCAGSLLLPPAGQTQCRASGGECALHRPARRGWLWPPGAKRSPTPRCHQGRRKGQLTVFKDPRAIVCIGNNKMFTFPFDFSHKKCVSQILLKLTFSKYVVAKSCSIAKAMCKSIFLLKNSKPLSQLLLGSLSFTG